ncbi:MAG: hypothetical protein ACHQIO_18595, partial [Nevskiales bacterium]
TLAAREATPLVRALIPAIGAEMKRVDTNLDIWLLELRPSPAGDVLALRANLLYPAYHGETVINPLGWSGQPEGWFEVRLGARSVFASSVVFLAVALVWPWRTVRELLLRLALTALLGALLFALDAPLDLLGNFQQQVLRLADPQAVAPLFVWGRFLEGGGSAALGLSMAVLAVAAAARFTSPRRESAPPGPGLQ